MHSSIVHVLDNGLVCDSRLDFPTPCWRLLLAVVRMLATHRSPTPAACMCAGASAS